MMNYPEAIETLRNGNRKDFFSWVSQKVGSSEIIRFISYLYEKGDHETLREVFKYWR